MHCTLYLSARYCARDVSSEASGVPGPRLSSDGSGRSGTACNVSLQQAFFEDHVVYVKEVMKQAMLKQEAVFRYQVHELHRLYTRQKELMNEVQRRCIQLQMPPQQQPMTHSVQLDISQKPMNIFGWPVVGGAGCDPSVLTAETINSSLKCEQPYTSLSSKIENGHEELQVFPPVRTKSGKRVLDLELPADHYFDSDEENCVEGSVKVPQIRCYPPKETSGVEDDSKLGSFHKISSPSLNSSCGRSVFLLDLNEPFQLEESDVINSSSHIEPTTCYVETEHMDRHLLRKPKEESEILDAGSNHTTRVGEDIDACSKIVHLEERQLEEEVLPHNSGADGAASLEQVASTERTVLLSESSEEGRGLPVDGHPKTPASCISFSRQLVPRSAESRTKTSGSISSSRKQMQELGKIPEVVQALPCFNNPNLSSKGSKSTSESTKGYKDVLHAKNDSASNPSSGNVNSYPTVSSDEDPTSEVCSLSKRFKTSSVVDMDLNCTPPRWSPEVVASPENDGNGASLNDTEDLVKERECSDGDGQSLAVDSGCCISNPFKARKIEDDEKVGKDGSLAASAPVSLYVECSEGVRDGESGTGKNFPRCKASVHSNSCAKEDEPSPGLRDQRELDAPVHPENKECSPPRGEPGTFQPEEPPPLSEDHQKVEEHDRIAAEAIISISSSGSQLHMEAATKKLEWFAGVVSSLAENLENAVQELADSDYFEATESNLREMEVEGTGSRSRKQNDQGCGRRQARRPRGFKKKALHTLVGVVSSSAATAAGAALENVTKRKRNTGKNSCVGKRRQDSSRRGLEQFMPSSFCAATGKDGFRVLDGWGSTKGRRKLRRARSVFRDFSIADS